MGRVCLVVTVVSLLWGYCSAQCSTWSTQPYQNSSDINLSDLTTTPLGFANDFLPGRETSTDPPTICVNVNVPGATGGSANYVFVAVESDGNPVCIRFEDSNMDDCNTGGVFLCNQLIGTSVQITFFCDEGMSSCPDTFFYYKMETISLAENDEDVWCNGVNREVPSFLAAATATVDITLLTTGTPGGALGLSFTPLLLLLGLLMGSLLLP